MDQYADNTKKILYLLQKEAKLPKYAAEHKLDDLSDLPSSAFANPITREYPVHTKEDTFLSAVYLNKTAECAEPYVTYAVDHAVDVWGIKEDVDKALSNDMTKVASSKIDINYTLNGQSVFHTTISDKAGFNKVANDILTNTEYPLESRQSVAIQLLDKCAEYVKDVDMGTKISLEKCAGYGTSTVDSVYDVIRNRALLIKDKDSSTAESLTKLAESIVDNYKDKGVVPKHKLDKVASFVDLVDRASGMHTQYSGSFRKPEEDLYKYTVSDNSMLKKYAVNLQNNKLISGKDIRDNFDRLQPALDNAFGIQVTNEKEARDQLMELPYDKVDLIYSLVFSK